MAEQGHNYPPPHIAFELEIEDLFAQVASAGEVTTAEQDAQLDALLDDVRRLRKDADAQRVIDKAPSLKEGKEIDARYKPILTKADRAADEIKKLLTPFRARQKAEKDAEALRVRQEAEALQKAAQEALQSSDDLEERFDAEEQLKAANKLAAQAKRIEKAPKGTKTSWTAIVEDRRSALNHLLPKFPERFEALIQQLADEACRGGRPVIPGIRYESEEVAV